MNKIYTLDSETDPFYLGRKVYPFAFCLYAGQDEKTVFWGDNCAERIADKIRKLPKCTVYAHNGGKFDFFFLLPYANRSSLKIINGRIAVMYIGKARLVDSWLLIPIPLADYDKQKIDYSLFERDCREENKKVITEYLISDCANLMNLLTGFMEVVGAKLTIGQAAFAKLKKSGLKIPRLTESHDETFRPYYFGGRCEAFEKGVIKRKLTYLDINSAYPWAMTFDHPTGAAYAVKDKLPDLPGPWFAKIDAVNRGALCCRNKDGLTFGVERGTFFATGWEIATAIRLGKISVIKVHSVHVPDNVINFSEYVYETKALRDEAKIKGDTISQLAYKFLMSSAYGKFATDPRDWCDYYLDDFGASPINGFEHSADVDDVTIFESPSYNGEGFYDVATAASITGKVRAYLMESMDDCKKVVYCDTDSIVCASFGPSIKIGNEVGNWKIEDTGHKMCIAGKKLYAFFGDRIAEPDQKPKHGIQIINGKEVKIASKGVKLTACEIERVSDGETIEHTKTAPCFSLKRGQVIITRKIRRN